MEGNQMSGTGRPKGDWSNWKCKNCGSSEKGHYKDYCFRCYRSRRDKIKYETDPIYREKLKAKGRKYSLDKYYRKKKEDPAWSANKQKEFRKKHPAAFNYCMCRYYFRRLSLEAREKLVKETYKEERCVMCGDIGMFKIGSGKTATLNGKDCTELIEAHYKKGQWLCEDCLFK
jgi:hypothetical protein